MLIRWIHSQITAFVKIINVVPTVNSSLAMQKLPEEMPPGYRSDFLWPHEDGSVEQAGYEFANGTTEEYRQLWWNIILDRVKDSS